MNSRTKALPNQLQLGPARRRAKRQVGAAALVIIGAIGAVGCGDASKLSGPFLAPYQILPAKTVLDSAPASAELKASKTLPRIGGLASSSLFTSRALLASDSRSPSGLTASAAVSAGALDPAPLVASSVPFTYEGGPFKYPVAACEDCVLGEQDASGQSTGRGFPIGFDFTFFGNTYNEFFISTNGFITFDAKTYDGCCSGGVIPEAYEPNGIIALAWSDLKYDDASEFGKISYETRGNAPHRRLIVDFNGVSMWSDPSETVSGQIVLYEGTNVIEMHTKSNHAHSNSLTQGVENADGSVAAFLDPARVQNVFDLDNDGVRFSSGAAIPNNAPTVNAGGNAGGPPFDRYEGVEGKTIKFAASAADADGDALTYAWDFDGDGRVDAETAQAEFPFNDNGKYTAKVTVSDGKDVATATVEVIVANAPPTADLKVSESVNEGSQIAVSVESVDDAAADALAPFEFAFDCGDGNGFAAFGLEASTSCLAVDNGSVKVGVKVRDKDGGESVYTRAVTVNNVAPVVEVPATVLVKSGQIANLWGRFSDVGKADKLWSWQWGPSLNAFAQGVVSSGSSSSGTTAEQGGTLTAQYRGCTAGTQLVTLEVTDKDGARGKASLTVVVEPLGAGMELKKGTISLKGVGDDNRDPDVNNPKHGKVVTVYLFSTPTFDATKIDPATVYLTNGTGKGTGIAVERQRKGGDVWEVKTAKLNNDGLPDVKLSFSRNELAANGDLTLNTSSLTLVGRVGTCVNVTATAPVAVTQ